MQTLLQGMQLRDIDWCFEKGIKRQSLINIEEWTLKFELEIDTVASEINLMFFLDLSQC